MAGTRAPVDTARTSPELARWMARHQQRPPLELLRADPGVVSQALTLADGDPRRLVVHGDGTIEVRNQPAW